MTAFEALREVERRTEIARQAAQNARHHAWLVSQLGGGDMTEVRKALSLAQNSLITAQVETPSLMEVSA